MIVTRKLPATNTQGARIKASGYGFEAEIAYPYENDGSDAHAPAALLVAQKYYPGEDVDVICQGITSTGYKFRIVRPE